MTGKGTIGDYFIDTVDTKYTPHQFPAGVILLKAAPCTAMVFVWSSLSDGDPGYAVLQVALNALIIVVAFAPIVAFLLDVSHVQGPMDTLLFPVVLFVMIPLSAGFISLFGLSSGATLATVAGALVEAPMMLSPVIIARASKEKIPQLNDF